MDVFERTGSGCGAVAWSCGLWWWLLTLCGWLGCGWVCRGVHAIHVQLELQRESGGKQDLNHLSWPWAKTTKVQTPLCCKRCWGSVNWHNLSTIWHLVVCCPCNVPVLRVGGAFWGALRLFWKVGESYWPAWLSRPWCGAGGRWKGLQNCLPAGEEVLGSFACSSWCISRFLGRLAQGLNGCFKPSPNTPLA